MNRRTALRLVKDELDRALAQHPSFNSCHEGYAVLLEEVDELWDEIKKDQGSTHRGASEAVQVAAMALRYLINTCDEETSIQHDKKIRNHDAKVQVRGPVRHYDTHGGYSG